MSDMTSVATSTAKRVRCVSVSKAAAGWRCQRTQGHEGKHTIKAAGESISWDDSVSPAPVNRSHKAKPKAPVMAAIQMVNHVAVCLDGSGSMEVVKGATINAYNANLEQIKVNSDLRKQKSDVSLYMFGHSVSNPYSRQPVAALPKLNHGSYSPAGGTPLLDCVGQAIEDLSKFPDANEPNVSFLVFVTTDGEENTSHNYTVAKLKKLMQEKNATDRWTFAFLVPPNCKQATCARLGLADGNVREWEGTTIGVQQAAVATSQGISMFYNSRAAGQGSTRSFFTPDLSKVKSSDVQRALTDIKQNVAVLKVEKECEIRDFVQSKGYAYMQGNAYYQLTKDEEVQAFKKILVKEKGKSAVYEGDDARQVLGIPAGDVKIRVGNMAQWDVFVQSTSVNRKLVRGTLLLLKV